MTTPSQPCPCGKAKPYANCCQPLHLKNTIAANAEQLMRSRYSAFACQLASYLLATHHPDFRSPNEEQALQQTLHKNKWVGLTIVDRHGGTLTDSTGTVEFKARCLEGTKLSELHACSNFIKEEGTWYYTDDKFRHLNETKIGRNDACWCGSGKKFKKCHG